MMPFTCFQVHKKFRKLLEGVRFFTWNSEELLIAWYNNTVLISSIDNLKICSVLNVNGAVHDIFQSCTSLFCLDQHGYLYVLKYVKNEDDVDIFNSSVDDDFDDNCQPLQKSFVPSLEIQNIICVSPISSGFVAVVNEFSKLYLEFYNLTSSVDTIQKLHCYEVSEVSNISKGECILKVFKSDRFTSDLCNQLVKTSRQSVDIVFIGLSCGNLYCAAVDTNDSTIQSKPRLIYSSSHLISGILCISNKQSKLYSKICIFLDYGIIVVISVSFSKSLHFDVTHLTSSPRTMLGIGDSFIVGDGHDLWHCTFQENTLAVDINLLPIKSVHLIEKIHNKNKVLAITFHSIFYVFSSDQISENSQSVTSSSKNISNITETMHQLLGKIEFYKEEIAYENSIIAAFSVSSRHSICKHLFSHKIAIRCLDGISLQDCFENCFYNFEDVSIDNKPPISLYCIDITFTNESDVEFFSDIWSIVISVTADNVTTQKVEKISHSYTCSSSISVSICKYIEKPHLGVALSVIVVRELPVPKNNEKGIPWLIIPIINKTLDADKFFNKCNILNTSDKLFHLQNSNTRKLSRPLKLEILDNPNLYEEIFYEFKLKRNSDLPNVWSTILNSFNAQNTVEKDCHNFSNNKFCLHAGVDRLEYILIDNGIRITSQNPHLLFAVKTIMVNKWLSTSDSFTELIFPATIVSRSLLYKEKLEVENVMKNKLSFIQFKEAWRNFISTNLIF